MTAPIDVKGKITKIHSIIISKDVSDITNVMMTYSTELVPDLNEIDRKDIVLLHNNVEWSLRKLSAFVFELSQSDDPNISASFNGVLRILERLELYRTMYTPILTLNKNKKDIFVSVPMSKYVDNEYISVTKRNLKPSDLACVLHAWLMFIAFAAVCGLLRVLV